MPDFSTRPSRRAPAPADLALLAGAVLALLLAGHAAWSGGAGLRRATGDVERARLEVETAGRRARELEARKGRAEDTLVSRLLLTQDAPPPRVLADLAALLPDAVRIVRLTLDYGNRLEVDVRVRARSASAYDLFLKRLSDSPLFADVVPGEESRDAEVQASLKMTYRGGSP